MKHDPVIVNAMSVDVEDYFQVGAFEKIIRRDDWDKLPGRVVRNTEKILDIFAEAGVKATFFTLGWVAARHPQLIRRMAAEGHEIASHGMSHVRAFLQSRQEFQADVRQSKALLEDISGGRVLGYRAASFSIGADNMWALDVLAEENYSYSSSVYPIRHDHYGMPGAPRFTFKPLAARDFIEVPLTTIEILGRRLPSAGGGYFRLLPYWLSRWAMKRVNEKDNAPCMFYFHPWEIDPDQPRPAGVGFKSRFRHYTNLDVMEEKLRAVLGDFKWGRVDQVFLKSARP
jgi:polysaccharide deacetylase family protein (PEP-CTERM system associated)